MPRKMRQPKLRTRPVSLASLSVEQEMGFVLPWAPRRAGDLTPAGPWATWTDYLDAYEAVRDECLAAFDATIFAERVWQFRERHGAAALQVSSYEEIAR